MNQRRTGYTLIELVVASASASVLVVGLSASLFVAGRALDVDEGVSLKQQAASGSLLLLELELAEATRFAELTAGAIEFTVPDRDADGLEESIRYSWSGVAGEALVREYNGGSPLKVLTGVEALSFTGLTRNVMAFDVTVAPKPPWPIIESFATDYSVVSITSTIDTPAGTVEGDLLIAALATDNNRIDSMAAPAGWIQLDLGGYDGKVTFGVWWRLATAIEPASHEWRWSGSEDAVAVIVRISNQYAGNPITSFVGTGGKSEGPVSSGTNVTLDNSLVLRFAGIDNDDYEATSGIADHTDLYLGDADGKVSVLSTWAIQQAAGACPELEFSLTKSEDYRTVTVIVAPAQN